jgi:hypothetical protein
MPQGGHRSDRISDVPEPKTYQRKKTAESGGPRHMPKSAKGALAVNMSFFHSMAGAARNSEMISAAKVVKSGKALTTPALQLAAAKQLEMDRKKKEKTSRCFDPESRKHVKGMRGDLDLDELGELSVELRSHLDAVRLHKAEAKRAAKAAAQSVAGTVFQRSEQAAPVDDALWDAEGDVSVAAAAAGQKRRRSVSGRQSEALVRALAGALHRDDDVAVADSNVDGVRGGTSSPADSAPALVLSRKPRMPAARVASSSGVCDDSDSNAIAQTLRPLFEPLGSVVAVPRLANKSGTGSGMAKEGMTAQNYTRGDVRLTTGVSTTRAALFAQLCELGAD